MGPCPPPERGHRENQIIIAQILEFVNRRNARSAYTRAYEEGDGNFRGGTGNRGLMQGMQDHVMQGGCITGKYGRL